MNLPPDVSPNDPGAPWNAPEAPDCPTCEGSMEWDDLAEEWACLDEDCAEHWTDREEAG